MISNFLLIFVLQVNRFYRFKKIYKRENSKRNRLGIKNVKKIKKSCKDIEKESKEFLMSGSQKGS